MLSKKNGGLDKRFLSPKNVIEKEIFGKLGLADNERKMKAQATLNGACQENIFFFVPLIGVQKVLLWTMIHSGQLCKIL